MVGTEGEVNPILKSLSINARRRAHIDYCLQRLGHWKGRKPAYSTARLLAACGADEARPLRSEEGSEVFD